MRHKIIPTLTSLLVAAAGFFSLAQVLSIHIRHHRYGRIDDSLLPFTAAQNSRLLIVGVGVLLLYLSLQVYRRKRLAFQLVSAGLIILIGAELIDFHNVRNMVQLVFYAITLALLLLTHRQYTVASDNLTLRRGAGAAVSLIAVVFIYATIGFAHLGGRDTGRHVSLPAAAGYAVEEIFTYQESGLPLTGREARWFLVSVNTAATVAYVLIITSLFQPLQFRYGPSRHDRALARRILANYGKSSEDFFKLWPSDKHYYFNALGDSFVAYKVVGRDALILGGPDGNPDSFGSLMTDFIGFCRRNGWAVSCVNAPEDFAALVVGKDFQRIFIGNEAVIDIEAFATATYRSKHFRYIKNRAERDDLQFEYWAAPLTDEQVATLRRISDDWLSRGSRREYTFALGYFATDYIQDCDVAILKRDGQVVAYANVVPVVSGGTQRSIDHMRYTGDMPPTGMHFLLMQLILRLHEAGITSFNLGLAPLSGLESRTDTSLPERLLAALKRLGSTYYSFGGLEQFKNKFEPDWQPRYMYYQGPATNLIRVTRNLTKALSLPSSRPPKLLPSTSDAK